MNDALFNSRVACFTGLISHLVMFLYLGIIQVPAFMQRRKVFRNQGMYINYSIYFY